MHRFCVIYGLILLLSCGSMLGQETTTTRILFVLDASASMQGKWDGQTKWSSARNIMIELADSLDKLENVEYGLRVYGHQTISIDTDCKDSKLEVRIGSNRAKYLKSRIGSITPRGVTPIAYSLQKAAQDFPEGPGRNIIILLTDGEESCEVDPCAVVTALQEANAFVRPLIVGMDVNDAALESFHCMGNFHNTQGEAEFREHLYRMVGRVLSTTTLQVNLLNVDGKPSETDVNMTFQEQATGQMKYNFYHTINHRGIPDTLRLDPVNAYRMVVHTTPVVVKDSIVLVPNKHNVVNVPAPQGRLLIEMQGTPLNSNLVSRVKALVKLADGYKTLKLQEFGEDQRYLVGKYDVELLTLPRIKLEDVEIRQSETTTIKIPTPGLLTLNKPFEVYGSIFISEGNRLKKIYELNPESSKEIVALQPGTYRLVYRSKKAKTMHTTIDMEVTVESGGSTYLSL